MYFKEPHQLLEYFAMLEEKSLFLIQMSQDSEQNLEELKTEYKKKREDLEYKIKSLNETKNQKKKQLEELNKSIIQLKTQRDEHKQGKTKDELLSPISKKLLELFNQIKDKDEMCSSLKLNTSNWTDIENKSTMDILSIIEAIIRQFLKKIKEYRENNNEKVELLVIFKAYY
jgi:DNA repair exonuclease SbcCD ATPase subunit